VQIIYSYNMDAGCSISLTATSLARGLGTITTAGNYFEKSSASLTPGSPCNLVTFSSV
jgi:hypothetical protein